MNKKLYALTLAAAIFTVGLFGCSGGGKKNTVLKVWTYYNAHQKQAFDDMLLEFNETIGLNKGIIVESYSLGSIGALQDALRASANNEVGAEEMPEIFSGYADIAFELDQMGLIADMSPYFNQKELDEYVPAYIDEGSLGNDTGLKIFPTAKSTEILALNITDWQKFVDATGADENLFKTWEGLTKLSQQYYEWTDSLTTEPNDGKALFGRDSVANFITVGSAELGKELYGSTNGESFLNLDKDIFRKLWDNHYIPTINGYFTEEGRFRSDDMKTGNIIAFIGSTTSSSFFPTEVTREDGTTYPIDIKVLSVPAFENYAPFAVQQGAGLVVTKCGSDKEKAASEFLKWFTDTEQNLLFCSESSYQPVKKEANHKDLLEQFFKDGHDKYTFDSIMMGSEILNNYNLYTTKPFKGGVDSRIFVENCFDEQYKKDMQKIQELIDGGLSRKEAVEQCVGEESFNEWFEYVKSGLESLVLENN